MRALVGIAHVVRHHLSIAQLMSNGLFTRDGSQAITRLGSLG